MPEILPRLRDHTDELLTHQRSLSFVRYLATCHEHGWPLVGDGLGEMYAKRWTRDACKAEVLDLITKAATFAGTTTDATWAGPLAVVQPLANAFLAYVRAASVLSKLATTPVPFNSSLPAPTSGGSYAWVGEGKVKPVTSFSFGTVIVGIAKVPAVITVTDELMRLSMPGTEAYLRNTLATGISEFVDRQFLDPSVAPVGGQNPGSITNGLTAQAPSGTTGAALRSDVDKLLGTFWAAKQNARTSVLIMAPEYVSMLAGAANSQTLTTNEGGTYSGTPVLPSASAGTAIIAVDASAILVASGGITMDGSKNALLQMDSAPTDPPTAATVPISLWQENLVALRAEFWVNWQRGRSAAVKYISPCAYVPGT
jgi:HK97 family phage major capsid protein